MNLQQTVQRSVVFLLLPITLLIANCSHNPHKADIIETKVEKSDLVATDSKIGVNKDGEMVYQKKTLLAEELRKLENDVYENEDRVYGTRKYNTLGLYGKYSSCLRKLPAADKAGLPKVEKLDRWSDKEEDSKLGFDASGARLAQVSEEKLRDRINKLQEYRRVLQDREDQYTDSIKSCEALAMKGKNE